MLVRRQIDVQQRVELPERLAKRLSGLGGRLIAPERARQRLTRMTALPVQEQEAKKVLGSSWTDCRGMLLARAERESTEELNLERRHWADLLRPEHCSVGRFETCGVLIRDGFATGLEVSDRLESDDVGPGIGGEVQDDHPTCCRVRCCYATSTESSGTSTGLRTQMPESGRQAGNPFRNALPRQDSTSQRRCLPLQFPPNHHHTLRLIQYPPAGRTKPANPVVRARQIGFQQGSVSRTQSKANDWPLARFWLILHVGYTVSIAFLGL